MSAERQETGHPVVVDSWLVADGRVRGLGLHEERFTRSCAELLPELPADEVRHFLDGVRRWLPAEGRWFPRIEAYGGPTPHLTLWKRPAPEPGEDTVALWVVPGPDPRTRPEVKGPDLPLLAGLRDLARDAGADDALLCDAEGTVLEAAHAAVVWWRHDTLCVPAPDLRVLPSVTRAHVERLAEAWRCPVARERVHVDELRELETWTLNALHGLRPVTAWTDASGRSTKARVSARAAEWRQAVQARAVLPLESPCAR